jgi:DNA replicative helicase MCM subunit Mcm2 (Cdc46/Mcm family)
MEMNMVAAHMLIKYPARLLPLFDKAIWELQLKWIEDLPLTDPKRKRWRAKSHCHARITHLPANVPELWKTKLPRSCDVGNFIEVRGVCVCRVCRVVCVCRVQCSHARHAQSIQERSSARA